MEPIVKHIRISITSERYEVAASLFDSVYGDLAEQVGGNVPPTPMTPAEELIMGIFSDDLSEDGAPSYFSCHDGETNTLGIRLVIRDGAAYLEYYLNGEYAGELACASFDKYKDTLDLDSAYLGYMSANTVTANCDDIIIDNVSFSK